MLRPARHVKAAVGRLQWHHRHLGRLQQRHPSAVRPQARPAAAAQGQYHHVGGQGHWPLRRIKRPGVALQPHPAVPHVELHPRHTQAVQPGAQQRGGFHVAGKHPARAAHKSVHAQCFGPVAQLRRAQMLQPGADLRLPGAITGGKKFGRLGVREVEPALARQQKFATHRRHGIAQLHRHPRLGQHFRRHQARRPPANHQRGGALGLLFFLHGFFQGDGCCVRGRGYRG